MSSLSRNKLNLSIRMFFIARRSVIFGEGKEMEGSSEWMKREIENECLWPWLLLLFSLVCVFEDMPENDSRRIMLWEDWLRLHLTCLLLMMLYSIRFLFFIPWEWRSWVREKAKKNGLFLWNTHTQTGRHTSYHDFSLSHSSSVEMMRGLDMRDWRLRVTHQPKRRKSGWSQHKKISLSLLSSLHGNLWIIPLHSCKTKSKGNESDFWELVAKKSTCCKIRIQK